MICPVCGKEIPDGSAVCPICGVALTAQQNAAPTEQPSAATTPYQYAPTAAVPTAVPQANPANMPRNVKEFIKQNAGIPQIKKMGSELNICAIVYYVAAGLTFLAYVVLAGNTAGIIDTLILAGIGLWLHLTYSRVAAIIGLVYSIFSFAVTLVSTGKPGGYLVLIIAVISVMYTFKAASAFKKFKEGATF